MSLQNRNYIWYLGISTVLALLATITIEACGFLPAMYSLVPELLVFAGGNVAGIDINTRSDAFRVSVFVASLSYYFAVLMLPNVMAKSLRKRVAVSLGVHIILSLCACGYAMCQWQR